MYIIYNLLAPLSLHKTCVQFFIHDDMESDDEENVCALEWKRYIFIAKSCFCCIFFKVRKINFRLPIFQIYLQHL